MLENFFVSDAKAPRNYFFTYNDDGFYQTLKKRVAEKLKTVDKSPLETTKLIHDLNLAALFILAVLANRTQSSLMVVVWNFLAALSLAWTVNISHNFAHQADNWRRYSMNISLMTWRDFRVLHVLVSIQVIELNLKNLSSKESIFFPSVPSHVHELLR
jgi:hypothetical protein